MNGTCRLLTRCMSLQRLIAANRNESRLRPSLILIRRFEDRFLQLNRGICTTLVHQKSNDGDLRKLPNKEWLKRLSPEQFYVCREKGTEAPFSGEFCSHSEEGLYSCVCCGATLFSSDKKFESNSGWASFNSCYGEDTSGQVEVNILKRADNSLGMSRTEIICKKCHSHVGHVFNDGPTPTGERHCVNSVALTFAVQRKKE